MLDFKLITVIERMKGSNTAEIGSRFGTQAFTQVSSTTGRIYYNEINRAGDVHCPRQSLWHERYIDTISFGTRQRYNSPSADLVHDLHDSLDVILSSTSGFRAHRPRHHAGTTTALLLLLLSCAGETTTGRLNSCGRAQPPFSLRRAAFRGPGTHDDVQSRWPTAAFRYWITRL